MSMALIKKARKYNDIYKFIAHSMRSDKNHKNGGSCSSMRELAKIYYRAHQN